MTLRRWPWWLLLDGDVLEGLSALHGGSCYPDAAQVEDAERSTYVRLLVTKPLALMRKRKREAHSGGGFEHFEEG
jgi:hypothetical protein